jgi:hypothetical protein
MNLLLRPLLVARKSLIETVREVQLLALTVALPLIFLVITVVTYNSDLLVTHPVWVMDDSVQGEAIITALDAKRYAGGDPVFETTTIPDHTPATHKTATRLLVDGEITALVGFEDDPIGEVTQVTIYGDALAPGFYRASTILENAIMDYASQAAGRPAVIEIAEQPLAAAGPKNEFDLYAPGMITFGLLMIIPQTAMLVAREVRWKTLGRLRLTRLRAWDLLGGISLARWSWPRPRS